MKIKRFICLIIALLCATVAMASCDDDNGGNNGGDNGETVCVHEYVKTEMVKPTCTADGNSAGLKCSLCGEVAEGVAVLLATGHSEVVLPAVAPTCTTPGKEAGKQCSVCKEILVPQKNLDVTAHSPVNDAAVAPTCTEDGKTVGIHCSVCNKVIVAQEVIPATHTLVKVPQKDATCVLDGNADGEVCSVCDAVIVDPMKISAFGHSDADSDGFCDVCEYDMDSESGKEEVKTATELFLEMVMNSAPTKITTNTNITISDKNSNKESFNGSFDTEIEGQNSITVYTYDKVAIPGVDSSADAVMQVSGKIYYKDGKYSEDGKTWGAQPPQIDVLQIKLNLTIANLGKDVTFKNNKLIAKVTVAQAKEILGVTFDNVSNDKIEIEINGNSENLTSLEIKYNKTEAGTEKTTEVYIKTSYTYIPVTLDFSAN